MSFRGSPVRRHAEILAGDEARIKKKMHAQTHKHDDRCTDSNTLVSFTLGVAQLSHEAHTLAQLLSADNLYQRLC